MSYRLMRRVLSGEPDGLTATETLVLLALAYHADDDGTQCWPSGRTLAAECRMTLRGVQQVLRRLADRGIIAIAPGHGRRSSQYVIRLNDERGSSLPGTQMTNGVRHFGFEGLTNGVPDQTNGVPDQTNGVPDQTNGVRGFDERRSSDLSRPITEQSYKQSVDARAVLRSLCFAARIGIPTAHYAESRLDEAASTPSRLLFRDEMHRRLLQRVVERLAPIAEAQGIDLQVVGGGDVGG